MLPDTWFSGFLDALVREHDEERVRRRASRFGRAGPGVRPARRWARFHLHHSGLAHGMPLPRPGLVPQPLGERPEAGRLVAVTAHHADVVVHTAALLGRSLPTARIRTVVTAVLAASAGRLDLAGRAWAGAKPAGLEREVGRVLSSRFLAYTVPRLGLALQAALACVDARGVARVAARVLVDGRVDVTRLARVLHAAERERESAVATVVSLEHSFQPAPHGSEGWARRQLTPAGLGRVATERLARHISHPPTLAGEAAHRPSRRLSEIILGQLVLAALLEGVDRPGALSLVATAAALLHVPGPRAQRIARRALHLHHAHQQALARLVHQDDTFAGAWGPGMGTWLAERVMRALRRNLDALVREIRETGELATLLAKAAAGNTLTEDEWRRVRDQLLDVCRTVPSLAVFALPGGALILPLLLKVLPFDLRPSCFRDNPPPESRP
jgi:hypothetical protein